MGGSKEHLIMEGRLMHSVGVPPREARGWRAKIVNRCVKEHDILSNGYG